MGDHVSVGRLRGAVRMISAVSTAGGSTDAAGPERADAGAELGIEMSFTAPIVAAKITRVEATKIFLIAFSGN
jgi:hypothetical protein